MHFPTALLVAMSASAFAAPLAAPQEFTAAAMLGSKKNVYLSTCNPRGLLGFLSMVSLIKQMQILTPHRRQYFGRDLLQRSLF